MNQSQKKNQIMLKKYNLLGAYINYSGTSDVKKKNDKIVMNVINPVYGALHLINLCSRPSDESQAHVQVQTPSTKMGVLTDVNKLKEHLRTTCWSLALSSDEAVDDALAKIWKTLEDSISCHVLSQRHWDETAAAVQILPKPGIQAVVVAFEEYMHDLLDMAFDIMYSQITTIKDFEDKWPKQKIDQKGAKTNVFHEWLADDKNITKDSELRNKLDECKEMKDLKIVGNPAPSEEIKATMKSTMNNQEREIRYACFKKYPEVFKA